METKCSLVNPALQYQTSYREMLAEFAAAGETPVPFSLQFPADDFPEMIKKLADCAKGIDIPPGFVAHSTFWLVDGEEQVIGASNLRHELTPTLMRRGGHIGYGIRPSRRGKGFGKLLLRLTLMEARNRGLTEVLLTCAEENVASQQVILQNGGEFDSKEFLPEENQTIMRYWIKPR